LQDIWALPDCQEHRTWPEITRDYYQNPGMFFSGGLGPAQTEDFRVWGCFKDHPCLNNLDLPNNDDAMCYKYHETQKRWYPWMLMSEVQQCSFRR
jgi:hypothetical protein